jgi:2-polyprenyl-3-methyl-5-hydroxy-6-metoxy-1,4-benzoquinol methylase
MVRHKARPAPTTDVIPPVPAFVTAHEIASHPATNALPAKATRYYESDRSPFLEWLGMRPERVLDIGCGAGRSGAWLRARGATRIVGIEVDPASAELARSVYDEVYVTSVESALSEIDEPFDLILCADVLEHLVDPWTVVRRLRERATPETVMAVSIPNIRNIGALRRIAIGDGFAYEAEGIFDQTHLRFFTRSNARAMLEGGGWRIERSGRSVRSLRARIASKLTRGLADEWLAYQWYFVTGPEPAVTSRG